MPPTQCILSGGIRSATKLSSSVASTKCRSLGGPKGPRGPRGPKVPKGAFGALGGDGPMGTFGVIPKPFRMERHFESRVIKKGHHSEIKAVA